MPCGIRPHTNRVNQLISFLRIANIHYIAGKLYTSSNCRIHNHFPGPAQSYK